MRSSARMVAVSIGRTMYGSPLFLCCPACAEEAVLRCVASGGNVLDGRTRLGDARVDGGARSGGTEHRKHHVRRRERRREREHRDVVPPFLELPEGVAIWG